MGKSVLLVVVVAVAFVSSAYCERLQLPSQHVPEGYKLLLYTGEDAAQFAGANIFEPYVFLGLCIRAVERSYIQNLQYRVMQEDGRILILTEAAAEGEDQIIRSTDSIIYYTIDHVQDVIRIDMLCTTHDVQDSDLKMVIGVAEAEALENIVLVLDRKFSWMRLRAVALIEDTLKKMLAKQTARVERAEKKNKGTHQDSMVITAEKRILKVYKDIDAFNGESASCVQGVEETRDEPDEVKNEITAAQTEADNLQGQIDSLMAARGGQTGQALYETEMRLRDLHARMTVLKKFSEASEDAGVKNMVDGAERKRTKCESDSVDKVWDLTVDRGRFNYLNFMRTADETNETSRKASHEYTNTLTAMRTSVEYGKHSTSRYPVSIHHDEETVV